MSVDGLGLPIEMLTQARAEHRARLTGWWVTAMVGRVVVELAGSDRSLDAAALGRGAGVVGELVTEVADVVDAMDVGPEQMKSAIRATYQIGEEWLGLLAEAPLYQRWRAGTDELIRAIVPDADQAAALDWQAAKWTADVGLWTTGEVQPITLPASVTGETYLGPIWAGACCAAWLLPQLDRPMDPVADVMVRVNKFVALLPA